MIRFVFQQTVVCHYWIHPAERGDESDRYSRWSGAHRRVYVRTTEFRRKCEEVVIAAHTEADFEERREARIKR